jgi:hypothetical protein
MLGQKSATMTLDLYGHLFPDQLDQVADRLDAAARAVVYPSQHHPGTPCFRRFGDGTLLCLKPRCCTRCCMSPSDSSRGGS